MEIKPKAMDTKSKEMDKFEKFIRDYEYSKVDQLPRFMKKRLDALKKIQLEHIDLLHQYHKEIQELEIKYEKLYKPLYEKRFKIVSGEHEPTEEECQLPSTIQNESDDQENKAQETHFSPQEEKTLESQVKGMPGFWLGTLGSSYNFNDSIEQQDRVVLKHLQDIRLSYGNKGDLMTYTLEFLFSENPYFTNKTLTKTYYLKLAPDEKDPFSYEGFEVIKSEGCEINWHPGKNVMVKTVTVKQQNKRDGSTREKKKEVERDSFFYFFKPPTAPTGDVEDETNEETNAIMAVDFELGEIIRQQLIPKAQLLYSGSIVDDDDDDMEDEEDEDDDDESIDYDEDSDMEDDSDESADSLSNDNKPILKKEEK